MRLLKGKTDNFWHGSEFPSLFNPQFVRQEVYKQERNRALKVLVPNHANAAEVHMGYFDTSYHNSFWSGVEERDPTMDIKLNEFVLSLPENMFFRDGMDRCVMRLGMQGILPDEIRLNRRRGRQGSDIVPRVRHFSQQAEQALTYIEASGLARELLNVQLLGQILRSICQGETGIEIMNECTRVLLPGLSAGLFLASFDTDFELNTPLGI